MLKNFVVVDILCKFNVLNMLDLLDIIEIYKIFNKSS